MGSSESKVPLIKVSFKELLELAEAEAKTVGQGDIGANCQGSVDEVADKQGTPQLPSVDPSVESTTVYIPENTLITKLDKMIEIMDRISKLEDQKRTELNRLKPIAKLISGASYIEPLVQHDAINRRLDKISSKMFTLTPDFDLDLVAMMIQVRTVGCMEGHAPPA